LAKAAPNDPAHTARGAHCTRRRRFKPRDRQTDRQTDTINIGKNSQHLMHSMQPKKQLSVRQATNGLQWYALGVCYACDMYIDVAEEELRRYHTYTETRTTHNQVSEL